ncbi:MAG: DNA-directed RNA polymerase subunit H [Candidatus Aenigmarchaeota archaeon]|nr:DNA-directed RNA polymerase subunit H [Candidatus Aenigmarchaeota archaeon]
MAEDKDEQINIFESGLVPKHEILTEDQKAQFLKQYNISTKQLPRIRADDPVVKHLSGKRGDVMRITRNEPVIGEYYYYRIVA